MQTKLSQRAAEVQLKNVHDLYNLLYDEDWLQTAQTHVRRIRGIPNRRMRWHDHERTFEENLEGDARRSATPSKNEGLNQDPCAERTIGK